MNKVMPDTGESTGASPAVTMETPTANSHVENGAIRPTSSSSQLRRSRKAVISYHDLNYDVNIPGPCCKKVKKQILHNLRQELNNFSINKVITSTMDSLPVIFLYVFSLGYYKYHGLTVSYISVCVYMRIHEQLISVMIIRKKICFTEFFFIPVELSCLE